jgi:hypothetical protein
MAKTVYLYEIEYYNTDVSAVEVLRLATSAFITQPTDTPSNTPYRDSIADIGIFSSYMFSKDSTSGQSTSGAGDFVLQNADGSLDYLVDYGFDQRSFVVKKVAKGAAYSTATTVYTGTISFAEFTKDSIIFRVRDSLYKLTNPAQTATFLGNNASLSDTEGEADLQGKIKPFVFGKVFNVAPVLVNPDSLIFAVNFNADGTHKAIQSFAGVYDGGSPISKDISIGTAGDFPTIAALAAASIGPAEYATCVAAGVFRLHTAQTFTVTCDVVEGATAADRTVSSVTQRLLADYASIPSGEFATGQLSSCAATFPAEIGIYVDDNRAVLACVNEVVVSGGFSITAGVDGKYRLPRLTSPSSTTVATITPNYILESSFEVLLGRDDSSLPNWSVSLGYQKNYTIQQDSDLSGSAVVAARGLFSKETYRKVITEDPAVKTKYLSSNNYEIDTLIVSKTDAEAERDRIFALRSVKRRLLQVPTTLDTVLEFGDTVEVVANRFGMNNGWKGVIVGFDYNFNTNEVGYLLYG